MVDLPGDVSERAVTVEEVMQKNLGHGSWPTAQVVILQMHAFAGASMNWSQLLISPVVLQAGVHGNVFHVETANFVEVLVWMYLEMFKVKLILFLFERWCRDRSIWCPVLCNM